MCGSASYEVIEARAFLWTFIAGASIGGGITIPFTKKGWLVLAVATVCGVALFLGVVWFVRMLPGE